MPSKTPAKSAESAEAIAGIDRFLSIAGMKPGRRATLKGSWLQGERLPRKIRAKLPTAPPLVAPKTARPLDVVRATNLEKSSVLHGFSTRSGGVTRIYRPSLNAKDGDLNLSWTKEDDVKLVAENRRRFLRAVTKKAAPFQLITLRQMHTPIVHVIRKGERANTYSVSGKSYRALATKDDRAILRGDGVMTNLPGLLLGIQTADCIPILLTDRKTGAVAAFHAGWRPTLARIVERGVGRMRLEYGTDPKNIIAAIGPGIGPCCYAVGEELRFEFESQFEYWKSLFTEVYDEDPVRTRYPLLFLTARAPGHSNIGPQIHLDLWEANRRQLIAAGVREKNITVTGLCTACNTERFFSHRAERGFTGRMLNVIGKI
jgi:YfiH family protein